MKRTLIVLAAAVLFLNTLVVPTIVRAEGVGGTCTAPASRSQFRYENRTRLTTILPTAGGGDIVRSYAYAAAALIALALPLARTARSAGSIGYTPLAARVS